MRKRMILLAVTALLALGLAAPASAHVHGVTPLLDLECTGVDNTVTGANQTDTTPASSVITGLIPRDVGNAPLTGGGGGRNAVGDTVCP